MKGGVSTVKNLKKVSCAALVCVLLSVLFVMPSYAAGFGGGSRGGEFSSGGFGGSTAQTRMMPCPIFVLMSMSVLLKVSSALP